jgi:hypothetical protein
MNKIDSWGNQSGFGVRLDYGRLLVEWVMIGAAAGLALLVGNKSGNGKSDTSKS